MLEDKIVYSECPKIDLLKFIDEWFELIIPFEVHKGYHFQIRIEEDQYETLKAETKELLSFQSLISNKNVNDGTGVYKENSDELRRWQEENYWSNCKAYIFDFDSDSSFVLNARCEYGYEGLEESYTILFFDKSVFPPLIYENIDTSENKNDFREVFNE